MLATSSAAAAASRKGSRTSAQTSRIVVPPTSSDWLPAVYHSSGEARVSPTVMAMRSGATPSSSAAICAIAVTMPWPSSTLPLKMRTVRSPSKRTQRSSDGVFLRLRGIKKFVDQADQRLRLLEHRAVAGVLDAAVARSWNLFREGAGERGRRGLVELAAQDEHRLREARKARREVHGGEREAG